MARAFHTFPIVIFKNIKSQRPNALFFMPFLRLILASDFP